MTTTGEESQNGDEKQKWSYKFTWTDDHLEPKVLKPLRHEYDELGALALEKLLDIKKRHETKGDLFNILENHHAEEETLTEFWNNVHSVPEWVDWEQLARGQKVFYRYGLANIIGFALQGFVCENSASTGVVEILVRTGGFSTRVLWGRLLETFQWLLQVTKSLEEVQPGGEGFKSTVRVRLLHSSVRRRILQLVDRRPEYYDVTKFGIPVNTMDSIHSITTFCLNPMFLQLPRMGIKPLQQEIEDYLALFRYIAHVIGTPTEYFMTVEKAKALMESCYLHELEMTETSQIVAHNFVRVVESLPPPLIISRGFIEAGSRWLNGHKLCNELGLGQPSMLSYIVFAGHCALVNALVWAQRLVPPFDTFMIELLRSKLYWAVIESEGGLNGGTGFEMKYRPQIDRVTRREEVATIASGLPMLECFFFLCAIYAVLIIVCTGYIFGKLIQA